MWLERKLPDAAARARILEKLTANLPSELKNFDAGQVIELTGDFTGADVKRLVEEAKGLSCFRPRLHDPLLSTLRKRRRGLGRTSNGIGPPKLPRGRVRRLA
jgi:SpoVK/Ycf46/Vps4 family AAA+-type ATPase